MTNFVFFGTSRISTLILERLHAAFNIIPALIVTVPDKPAGRKQIITPPPVKIWANAHNIPVLQPERLKDPAFIEQLKPYDLFVLVSYGKMIPKEILDLPKHSMINIHPSLLPKYRGASPIQYQILNNEQHVGTTIMMIDEEMDHGPIIAQKEAVFDANTFPAPYGEVEEKLARESADLLADILPKWIAGTLEPIEQRHSEATYTSIIKKDDAEISLADDPFKNYLKYLAYREWPKVFFYFEKDHAKMRAIITKARFENNIFIIEKVIPEGKKEMSYDSFLSMLQQQG